MKITGFRIGLLSAGLRVPFRTALREVRRLEDVVVELQTSDGRTGRGEAPPTAAITGETLDSLIAALRDCICPRLVGRDIEEFRALPLTNTFWICGIFSVTLKLNAVAFRALPSWTRFQLRTSTWTLSPP